MGANLEKIYQIVTNKTGFKGRMRLAVKTGISRLKAVSVEDSPELLSRFKEAADEIVGTDIDQFLRGGNNG